MRPGVGRVASVVALVFTAAAADARAQSAGSTGAPRSLQLGVASVRANVRLDGRLSDPAWARADSIELTQVEPQQGAPASARTVVRVLATADALVIGIRADDPQPDGIVAFARQRDALLDGEDHVKVVLDTYRDGRSGYVFAVNPNGSRYDALVADGGEHENSNWDGVWQALTARTPTSSRIWRAHACA